MAPCAYVVVKTLTRALGIPHLTVTEQLITLGQEALVDAELDEAFGCVHHLRRRQFRCRWKREIVVSL